MMPKNWSGTFLYVIKRDGSIFNASSDFFTTISEIERFRGVIMSAEECLDICLLLSDKAGAVWREGRLSVHTRYYEEEDE